jgi:thiol-disulfide isomerase/thioredoxin
MSVDAGFCDESAKPQERVVALMGRAFDLQQMDSLSQAATILEEALSEARKTPYEIEFQTRIQLAMSLADTFQRVGQIQKACAMLLEESAFAERISQIMQATGTPSQKRSATSGFLQIRDRSIQMSLLGKESPELQVKEWIRGGIRSLAESRGQVVLLEFWATWCKPCQEMFPKLTSLHETEGSKGLEIVALTRHYLAYGGTSESLMEERQLMLDMVDRHGVKFHVGVAKDEKLQSIFGANGLPTMVLIDRSGMIRYAGPGEGDPLFNKELQDSLNS